MRRLTGQGFIPNSIHVQSCDPPFDQVVSTEPLPNTQVRRGSTVNFTIQDQILLIVPDVVNQVRSQAVSIVQGTQLVADTTDVPSRAGPYEIVLRTNPPAGTQVPCGSHVILEVKVPPAEP